MKDNSLLELVLKRRSVRRYKTARIDDEIIDEILKVGLAAPTAFGNHDVEFVVVRNSDTIQKVGACKTFGGSQINGADTVIVVMAKTADKHASEFWIEDAALASGYMLLAIEQYNLGACWVHIRNRKGQRKSSDEEIRELLGVPDGYTVLNLIALGEKGEIKSPYTEANLNMKAIHYVK